jgi:hypothetical protein
VAEKPDHDTPVRSYPDHPRPGTTKPKKTGGAKNTCGNRRAESLSVPIRVVRVDTIPMTAEEFDNAIEAWAVLLNRYWQHHPEDAT